MEDLIYTQACARHCRSQEDRRAGIKTVGKRKERKGRK